MPSLVNALSRNVAASGTWSRSSAGAKSTGTKVSTFAGLYPVGHSSGEKSAMKPAQEKDIRSRP